MKPFDLEKALGGEPVVLRCGRKAFLTCDLRRYFKNTVSDKKLIGIVSEEDDHNSFAVSASWYDSGYYYDVETIEEKGFDIIGMYEEPKLTTEEIMEKAFQEKLIIRHSLLLPYHKGFKVVGKTRDGDYILQDCDGSKLSFLCVFNEDIEWSIKD